VLGSGKVSAEATSAIIFTSGTAGAEAAYRTQIADIIGFGFSFLGSCRKSARAHRFVCPVPLALAWAVPLHSIFRCSRT
jgi:hypothetical protein